jgi:hypothetical protein
MSNAPFIKMNGIGNEITVVDLRAARRGLTADEARRLAGDPRTAFDQLMTIEPARAAGTDAFMTIFNTDGSLAGACGNGTRCVALVAGAGGERKEFVLRDVGGPAPVRPGRPSASPSTWASRASAGRTFRSPRNSATPAASSCRSGRSMRRSCTRPRWCQWAIRTRSSGSRMSTPSISPKHRADAREPPDLPRARQHLARAGEGPRPHPCCGSGSAAWASPAPAAPPPAPPLVQRRGPSARDARATVTLPGGDLLTIEWRADDHTC